MKRFIRIIALSLLVVCIFAMLASCGSASIVGRWRATAMFGSSVDYEFTEDGTFNKYSSGQLTGTYSYTYENEIITYKNDWGSENYMTVEKLTSDEMIISEGGFKVTFKRIK